MKKYLVLFITLISLTSFSQGKLKYSNWVNDFAGVLTTEQESKLNKKIADFEKKTDIEFAIVTVKSLEGRSIEGFTHDLASRWGVGKKGKDNGLMILIAPNERKWRIEVGYGLEEYITDGYSKVEAERVFPKNFKKNDYYGGIDPLVSTFQKRLGTMTWAQRQADIEKKKREEKERAEANKEAFLNVLMWIGIIVFGIIVFAIIRKVRIARREKEEARQRKIKKYKSDIEKQKTVFEWHLAKVKRLYPEGVDFSDWENTFSRLSKIYEDARKDDNIVNLDSRLTEARDVSAYEKVKMQEIIKVKEDFDEIKWYVDNNTQPRTVETLMQSIENFEKENDKGVYSISWTADKILKDIAFANVALDVIKVNLSIDKIDVLRENHSRCLNSIERGEHRLGDYRSQLDELYRSKANIENKVGDVPSLIKKMDKKCKDSDVSSSTKRRAKDVKKKYNNYSPNFEQAHVIGSWVTLSNIISEIESVIRKAQDDIDEEDRRRRRRRRSSSAIGAGIGYGSSSSSSWGSSGGGGFGSFGGGSFGGGGSSGGW
jgi:uncharacterized protein